MFSEDYILRLIRQATAVFARIIGLKNTGQYQEALQVIDNILEQLLGMDANVIERLEDENLYTLLMKNDVLDLDRLELIADLFAEKGEIHKKKNLPGESVKEFVRALNYYLVVYINHPAEYSTKLTQKIDSLLQTLAPADLEEQTLLNLYDYFQGTKEYTRAEDMLDKLAARNPSVTEITVEEKKAFYKRLLDKNDEELANVQMSREQIQKKLNELESSHKKQSVNFSHGQG